jgi:hypothetical protein
MNRRADRAKIVSLACRALSWILLGRRRLGRLYACNRGVPYEPFEMNVSERKDKLQRHRCKRQPTPTPLSRPSPTHWQIALTHAWHSLQRSRSRATTCGFFVTVATTWNHSNLGTSFAGGRNGTLPSFACSLGVYGGSKSGLSEGRPSASF